MRSPFSRQAGQLEEPEQLISSSTLIDAWGHCMGDFLIMLAIAKTSHVSPVGYHFVDDVSCKVAFGKG
jgi:hypothetical protein